MNGIRDQTTDAEQFAAVRYGLAVDDTACGRVDDTLCAGDECLQRVGAKDVVSGRVRQQQHDAQLAGTLRNHRGFLQKFAVRLLQSADIIRSLFSGDAIDLT